MLPWVLPELKNTPAPAAQMVSLNVRRPSEPPDLPDDFPSEAKIEAMVEWFKANFEDPVHNMPYESAEGGYQYIWGGPYDAAEEIADAFSGGASEDEIAEAVARVEEEAVDWAPSDSRIYDEEEPEEIGDSPSELDALFRELQRRLDELEARMADAPPRPPGIGHNNPPEGLDWPPYTLDDSDALNEVVKSLRQERSGRPPDPSRVAEQINFLGGLASKIFGWFAAKGDKAVDAFASEFGKRAAQVAAASGALWAMGNYEKLAAALVNAANAANAWLQAATTLF